MADTDTTPFSDVYDSFLSKITDDMYMELTKEDTEKMLEDLLISSIPKFEFPRINLFDYEKGTEEEVEEVIIDEETGEERTEMTNKYTVGHFNVKLNSEEINILATYMIVEWLGQQLASVENTRMKFSGTDFKFTSQANHMQKLLVIKKDYEREGFHLQRLYKRRKPGKNGEPITTLENIMTPLVNRYRGGKRW